jgi:surface protein
MALNLNFDVLADFAVRKQDGLFEATVTTNSGTVEWSYGDGQGTDITNTPSYTLSGAPTYLINMVNPDPFFNEVTGITATNQNLTAIDIKRFPNLVNLDVSDNSINNRDIGKLLIDMDNTLTGPISGTIDYSGNQDTLLVPQLEARDAYDSLVAKGMTIIGKRPLNDLVFTVDTTKSGNTGSTNCRMRIYRTTGTYDVVVNGVTLLSNQTGNGIADFTSVGGAGIYDVSIVTSVGFNGYVQVNNDGDDLKYVDIKQWGDTFLHTRMDSMFRGCGFTRIETPDAPALDPSFNGSFSNAFAPCRLLEYIDVSNWVTSEYTNIGGFFNGCTLLTEIVGLETWDTSNVTNFGGLFTNCSSLVEVNGIETWDFTKSSIISSIFQNCSSLVEVNGIETWDTSNVTNFSNVFTGCTSLTTLQGISGWDVSKGTTFVNIFNNCQNEGMFDLSNWVIRSDVNVSLQGMFDNCGSLTEIKGISGWDTSTVTSFANFFDNCTALTETTIKQVENWDVSSVEFFTSMFNNCDQLTSIDLSNWTINTTTGVDMNSMFANCNTLNEIIGLDNWDVSRVTSLNSFFSTSPNLNQATIDSIENWDIQNVTTLAGIFQNLTTITSVNISGWVGPNVSDINSMFRGCQNVVSIDTRSLVASGGTNKEGNMTNFCLFCPDLQNINLSSLQMRPNNFQNAFSDCESLVSIDLSNIDFTACNKFNNSFQDTGSLEVVNLSGCAFTDPNTSFNRTWERSGDDGNGLNVIGLGDADITGVTDFTLIFGGGSNLTTESYDNILIGWGNQPLTTLNESPNFEDTQYSPGGIYESTATTGTASGILVDSTQTFSSDNLVAVGDYIYNVTLDLNGSVTSIDSETQLSHDGASGLIGTGDEYIIIKAGTTTSDVVNQLVDSGQNFLTSVSANDIVYNSSDNEFAKVTSVSNDTTLVLDHDIMENGDNYFILKSDAAKGRYNLYAEPAEGGLSWTITDGGFIGQ